MATEIILDDWALPLPFDVKKDDMRKYEIDNAELEKSIQKNRETIMHMRKDTKYIDILQKV